LSAINVRKAILDDPKARALIAELETAERNLRSCEGMVKMWTNSLEKSNTERAQAAKELLVAKANLNNYLADVAEQKDYEP
jgi:hypothetical protein